MLTVSGQWKESVMSEIETVSNAEGRPVYTSCYRSILRAVDRRYDIRGHILSDMVLICLANHGRLPMTRRHYYLCYAQEAAIRYLEELATELLYGHYGLLGKRTPFNTDLVLRSELREPVGRWTRNQSESS